MQGRIELDPAYAAGLADLDGFTHLHLITHLHRTGAASLRVTPYLDTSERGVFATRSPKRPNPIGLSLVRLVRIEGTVLHVEELDLLDGTPLLDIKPYVPPFDDRAGARYGWFEQRAQGMSTRCAPTRASRSPGTTREARAPAARRGSMLAPMTSLQFGVTILPDPPCSRFVELVQAAEASGYDWAYTYDSHILWQDGSAFLAAAAAQTERIGLGFCVTNPGTREPTVTASFHATLNSMAPGRVVVMIGRGDSARRTIGLEPVKVREFEAATELIRELANGRTADWNGKQITLEWAKDLPGDPGLGGRLRPEGARRSPAARATAS